LIWINRGAAEVVRDHDTAAAPIRRVELASPAWWRAAFDLDQRRRLGRP